MTPNFRFAFFCACAALAIDTGFAQTRSAAAKRPFSVRDSIELTRIMDPEARPVPSVRFSFGNAGTVSPDGRSVAVLVTNGDVSNNTNVYRLILYDTATLFTEPRSREVVRMVASSCRPGIVAVKWLADSRRIAFLGEQTRGTPQIWMVDTQTVTLTQLTHHKTVITEYDISAAGSAWVYVAEPARKEDPLEYRERGFVFSWPNQSIEDVAAGRYAPSPNSMHSEVYVGKTGGREPVLVKQEAQSVSSLSISPDGKLVVEGIQIGAPPTEWTGYEDATMKRLFSAARDNKDPSVDTDLYRFFVVDTANGERRPLLDAPHLLSRSPALWMKDSREVILSWTYLPLSFPQAARGGNNNVIAVRIDDGSVQIIRAEPDRLWLEPVQWSPQASRLVLRRSNGELSVHVKTGAAWTRLQSDAERQVRIGVVPASDKAPELEAQQWLGTRIQNRNMISHLNPQLDELTLAPIKAINWRGKDGMSWKAIAYMPPGYDPGKRYPLVIQTHGYSEKTFEPDGTSTTVMAAQPLANSGIVVVQLGGPDGPAPRSILQATQWMKGIEGLVDTLDAQGLVNRQRVGMTGWSATGWLVEYFLTHSEYPIRAAIAADNVEYGYWEYLLYATRTGFVSHYDEVYGDSPWKKPDTWWKDSPAFELQRVQTPLRIEVDSDPPIGHWQIYAGLKLLHKPVELVIIPDDYHSLVRPSHRMTSQGGAVDWFRFWLKDEEDTDPSKSQQYARWHTMRDQKEREGAR